MHALGEGLAGPYQPGRVGWLYPQLAVLFIRAASHERLLRPAQAPRGALPCQANPSPPFTQALLGGPPSIYMEEFLTLGPSNEMELLEVKCPNATLVEVDTPVEGSAGCRLEDCLACAGLDGCACVDCMCVCAL